MVALTILALMRRNMDFIDKAILMLLLAVLAIFSLVHLHAVLELLAFKILSHEGYSYTEQLCIIRKMCE